MKFTHLLFSSVFALLLASCGENSSSSSTEPSSSSQSASASEGIVIEGVSFEEKAMTAYLHAPDKTKNVNAYFRLDGLKNIPYVKVSDFYLCHL
nr:hypothetical protein [Bacilli bacterium]